MGRKMLLRFRCEDCALQMVLHEKPEKCYSCGSTRIVREGWRQRHSRLTVDGSSNEKVTE